MMKITVARDEFGFRSLIRRLISLLATVVLALVVAKGLAAQGERIEGQDAVRTTIYVDPHYPRSSDQNPGTKSLPIQTLGKALTLARENLQDGISTRIMIAKGIYRESLT